MIKAEIISHEGNPGPNWLDRCRTAATPGRLSIVVAVLIVGSLVGFISLQNTNHTQPTVTANQQNTYPETQRLSVEPIQQQTAQTEAGAVTPQTSSSKTETNQAPASASETGSPGSSSTSATDQLQSSGPSTGRNSSSSKAREQVIPPLVQDINSQLQNSIQTTTNNLRSLLKPTP